MRAVKAALRRRLRMDAPNPDALSVPETAVLKWSLWRDADSVFVYQSLCDEASTALLICDARRSGKRLIIPGCSVSAAIPCPDGIDLAVVPGLAFDKRGYRLGRGGGYYDRFLALFTGVSVGLVSRIVDILPVESHDCPVDYLVYGETIERVS